MRDRRSRRFAPPAPRRFRSGEERPHRPVAPSLCLVPQPAWARFHHSRALRCRQGSWCARRRRGARPRRRDRHQPPRRSSMPRVPDEETYRGSGSEGSTERQGRNPRSGPAWPGGGDARPEALLGGERRGGHRQRFPQLGAEATQAGPVGAAAATRIEVPGDPRAGGEPLRDVGVPLQLATIPFAPQSHLTTPRRPGGARGASPARAAP
jgi:hypothetical protein